MVSRALHTAELPGATLAAGGAAAEAGADALDPRELRRLLERHGDHPSSELVFNAQMRCYTVRGIQGAVPYRERSGVLYAFGGPIAAPEQEPALLDAFLAFAARRSCEVFGVQIRERHAELLGARGFRLNQLGCSYTLALQDFALRGHAFMKLRSKLKQPHKAGVQVYELAAQAARGVQARAALAAITAAWLRAKGRHVRLLEFLVGELRSVERPGTRCFIAAQGGAPLAFITYVPSYGRFRGYMHDLTRRVPAAPPGTMELINWTAIQSFQREGVPYLNFGLTPFLGVTDTREGHSAAVAWIVRMLGRHGQAVYPAAAQLAYKLKWQPQHAEPEYLAFRGRFRLGFVWNLLRLTRAL